MQNLSLENFLLWQNAGQGPKEQVIGQHSAAVLHLIPSFLHPELDPLPPLPILLMGKMGTSIAGCGPWSEKIEYIQTYTLKSQLEILKSHISTYNSLHFIFELHTFVDGDFHGCNFIITAKEIVLCARKPRNVNKC